MIAATFAV